ncbi:hypothetical protein BDZ97DRAFT_2077742 [Flammula alnicola]|nr:hypothetical protein BDZ97DRAFT_2077742 [Flammula alnicola]
MQKQSNQRKLATTISDIPEGFTIGTGPDGQQYLVPQYMVPALDHAFALYQSKADLGVSNAPGGSQQAQNRPFTGILAEGKIMFPPDPQLSDHERLTLHAEVLALQEKLGISYKDASHRLYMAEVEKLKVADETYKAFKNLDSRIETSLKTLQAQFGDPKANAEADAEVIPDADAE